MATKLGTLTLDLVAKISNFTQGMRQASSSAEREMQRASSSVNVMNGMLGKLAATAGAAFSINQVKNYADSYIEIVNKLKLVTNGQAELNTAMADTYRIAQATTSSWSAVNDVYSKYMANAKTLNLTQAETARLTEITSKAVAISGSTTQSASGALFQYGQSLDGNILRAQEYNSLVDGAGGLLNAMAKGLNVTRGELRQMMLDGKLTGEVITKALLKAGNSVDELYSKTDTTATASLNLLTTEATKLIGEFDAATGSSKTFVESIKFLAQNMEALTNVAMLAGAYLAGTYIPAIYGTVAAGLTKTKQMVDQTIIQYGLVNAERAAAASSLAQAEAQLVNTQSTLAAIAAEKALEVQRLQAQINAAGRMATATRMAQLRQIEVQVTAELTAAETALAAARNRATAATAAGMGAGRTALGILGGPVGMGVTLAAVAAGYLLMKGDADKATASIDYQGQKLEDLIVKYRELNTLQRDNETKALADQVHDLTVKFRVASSDLSSFMQALPASDEKINFFVKLTKEYQNGKISSDAYYKAVKDVNFLTDEQLGKVRGLVGVYSEAKGEFDKVKAAQQAFATSLETTTQKTKEQAAEVAGLTEEIKKLLGVNAEGTNKSNYLKEMVDLKVDPKLAEMLYEARKAEGLQWGKNQVLSDAVRKSVLERWRADQGLNKTLEERAKIEERNKKAIEAQGNAMKVNAKVAANAAKYNFAGIESKNKLPAGLLSAIHMQESKGDANAYNKSSGATGGFQFLKATGDQYGIKNRKDLSQSAEAAGKYMAYLLKLFEGDLDKAVSAYHAGEGNVQRGTNIGPVNRQYVKNIKGYMAGSSGVKFNEEYSSDDWIKEQEKLVMEREKYEKEQAEKQKQLALEVATYKERVNTELADKIKEVNEAGFGEAETKRLTAEYQKRAAIDIQVSEAAHADKISEYSDYLKSEEVLLNESFARRQRDLKLDLTLTVDEYKKASLLLEGERDKELQKARWRALEVRQAMVDQIKGLSAGADEIFAKATMSPTDYDRWSLENDRSNAKAGLKNQRVGTEQDIMTSDAYSTDDQRYEALLEAHKEYRDGMAAIDVEYAEQAKELDAQQYNDSMNMYGALLSQAGSVWGDMTQLVKDSQGEQSGAYKAMFLMQQMFAIGSALVSTHLAAAQVMADPTALTLAQKTMYSSLIMGMGYANVGLIAGQTIAGMAHDGIDNIPKEGTWLLDKGERVVDSRTNADLKNMIANSNNGGPQININVPPGYTAEQSRGADGAVTIDIVEKRIKQSWGNLGNPNSFEAKQIQRNTTAGVKR